jgi:integrase
VRPDYTSRSQVEWLIQEYLGHSSPATTSIYTHLTVKAEELGSQAINKIMTDL